MGGDRSVAAGTGVAGGQGWPARGPLPTRDRGCNFSVVDDGIKWRALPADFPPWSTVYNYFAAWEAAGVTQDVLDGRVRVRLPKAARRLRMRRALTQRH